MSNTLAEALKAASTPVEGDGGGGGRRRLFAVKLQQTRDLRAKIGTQEASEKPSDFEFFRRFVIDTDWDETVLREKLLTAIVNGKNLNDKNPTSGATILHMACSKSSVSVVNALLRCKADPHIKTEQKRTALHYAASNRDPKVVALLLTFLDNPIKRQQQRDVAGFTPFELACSIGNGPTAKFLFDRYPKALLGKTSKKDKLKRSILHLLLTGMPNELQLPHVNQLLGELIEVRPMDVWARDVDQSTPLAVHVAQHYRNENMTTFGLILSKLSQEDVDKAIYLMFNKNLPRSIEWKPEKWLVLQRMMTSSMHAKYVPCAIHFVSNASLLAYDASKRSILHWLAIFGFQPSLIEEVSEFKSELDDSRPHTEIHAATGVEMPILTRAQTWLSVVNGLSWEAIVIREPIKTILDEMKGNTNNPKFTSQISLYDKNKDTPLHIAAKYNNPKAIAALYRLFGDECKQWKDSHGKNALHVAAEFNAGQVIIELQNNCGGWNLDELDYDGWTPYMLAMREKKLVAANLLKAFGSVDNGLVSKDGTTIETLIEKHNEYASAIVARREARRVRLAKEEDSEEEDYSSTERHSVEELDDDVASTGSVEIKSDPEELSSPVGSDGEEDEGNSGIPFRPTIKMDSDYDEENSNGGGGIVSGHKKALPGGRIISRVGRNVSQAGARIAKDDEYKSDGEESSGDEDGGYNSMEEKSNGSEQSSPSSSPATSPRVPQSPTRVESPPPPISNILSPRSSPGSNTSSPRIKQQAIEMAVLAQQLEEIRSELRTSQSNYQSILSSKTQLEKSLRMKETEHDSLASQLREKESLLSSQTQEMSALLTASQNGNNDVEKWQEKVKQVESENASLKSLQSSLESQVQDATSSLTLSATRNTDLDTKIDSLKDELTNSKAEVEKLLSALSSSTQTIDSLQSSLKLASSSGARPQIASDEVQTVEAGLVASALAVSQLLSSSSSSLSSPLNVPAPIKKSHKGQDWMTSAVVVMLIIAVLFLYMLMVQDDRPTVYYS
jgi:ankyrin repeat protein/predicted  nucleic acid-binding Zn-ribbon protein